MGDVDPWTIYRCGPLAMRWRPASHEPRLCSTAWFYWRWRPLFAIRFGKDGWKQFSERYQGTHGIPRRYHYLFGKRITIISPYRAKGATS